MAFVVRVDRSQVEQLALMDLVATVRCRKVKLQNVRSGKRTDVDKRSQLELIADD